MSLENDYDPSKPATFKALTERIEAFANDICSFPSFDVNLLQSLARSHPDLESNLVEDANKAHPFMHARLRPLVKDFLWVKLRFGTKVERNVYKKLFDRQVVATDRVERAFYHRLLLKRPVSFWPGLDSYLLQSATSEGSGMHQYTKLGSLEEKYPLNLERLMSFDEMQVSAFIGLASATHFVNTGDHFKCAYRMKEGTFQRSGVLIGICPPQLEPSSHSEWRQLVITPQQNTQANGYGSAAQMLPNPPMAHHLLSVWAKFYREGDAKRQRFYFPTYDDAVAARNPKQYAPLLDMEGFLNVEVCKQRLQFVLEPLFLEANSRGKHAKAKAYVHLTPFEFTYRDKNLIDEPLQGQIFADVCMAIIRSIPLPHVSDVHFSEFVGLHVPQTAKCREKDVDSAIHIHTEARSLADPLPDPNKLLVAMYTLDCNALVGSEYWLGLYSFSSNSLAACCSTICQIHNPFINHKISGWNLRFHGQPPPKHRRGEISEAFGRYAPDRFATLDELAQALEEYGVENCNLIIGVDFTASNLEQGARTFGGKPLHYLFDDGQLNPYQQVISIICKTLRKFDADSMIPAFGFGDVETTDEAVFPFWPDGRECNGLEEVLGRYNAIVPERIPSGPTNFAPLINSAIDIVNKTQQYHILVIVADGRVTAEDATIAAIQRASNHALSIVCVGVGDGPWDVMEQFDDRIRDRWFYNFHFVDFFKTVSQAKNVETSFAHCTLAEIPQQYHCIKRLGLLGSPDSPLKAYEASPEYGLISRTFKGTSPDPKKRLGRSFSTSQYSRTGSRLGP